MKTVIEMAHEVYGEHTFWTGPQLERLKQFAELVRADEREACAKVCDAVAQQMDDEGEGPTGNIGWVSGCADAIRARTTP
jgi:hypothetical protein